MMQNLLPTKHTQSGMTLIIGMIMVLLITIIGLAAIRGSGLQEQMAGNMRDRQVAFEAAEAALRGGEGFVLQGSVPIGSQQGFVASLDSPAASFWLGMGDAPFDWAAGSATVAGIDGVSEAPRYVVEEVSFIEPGLFGGAADWSSIQNMEPEIMYRITARGVGGNANSVVVLQSTAKTM
ncbi:MAG TPA: PilX N-terminal domain-containing pilus assembly protein [Cellvibrionaceae bacterium]